MGTFEYPKQSGNWYTGKHAPIITQELFDKVQERLGHDNYRGTYGNKEFAFTKLMRCGLCGSGITADEKFKKQKNGNVHRYVYYGCTKFNDKECKAGYLREEELINQLENLMDKINLDEIGVKEKIKSEIERYQKFQTNVLQMKKTIKTGEVDIRNYAKYILREGTNFEKRELLTCLKSKIIMKNKQIYLTA